MKVNSLHDNIKLATYGSGVDLLYRESFHRHPQGAMGVTVDSRVDKLLNEMKVFSNKSAYDDETELLLLHESAVRIHNDAMMLYDSIASMDNEGLILYTEAKLMGLLKNFWTKTWNIVIKLKDIVIKFFSSIFKKTAGGAKDLSFSNNGFKISHEAILKTFPADKAKGIMDSINANKSKAKKMGTLANENDAQALIKKGITGDGSPEDITKLLAIICGKVTVASGSLAKDTIYQTMVETVFGGGISDTFNNLVGMATVKESKEGLFKKKTSDRTLRDVVRMSIQFNENNKNLTDEFPVLNFNTVASNSKAQLKLPTEKTLAFFNSNITKEGVPKTMVKHNEELTNAIKALAGGISYDGFNYDVMAGVMKTIDEYNSANSKFLHDLNNTLGEPKITTSSEDLMKAIDATLGFCFEVFMGKSEGMLDWPMDKVLNGLTDSGIVIPGNITIAQLSALLKYNNIDLLLKEADKEIGATDGEKVEDPKDNKSIATVKFGEAAEASALSKLVNGEGNDNKSSSNNDQNSGKSNPLGDDDNTSRYSNTAENLKKNVNQSDADAKKKAEADAKNTKQFAKSQDKLASYLNKVRREREKLGSVQEIANINNIDGIKKSIEYIAKLMGDFPYDNNFKSVKKFIQIEGASTKMMMNMFNTIKDSLVIIKNINESTRAIPGDLALRIWGITKIFIIASDSYSMIQKVKPEMDKNKKGGIFKKKTPKDDKAMKDLAKKGE